MFVLTLMFLENESFSKKCFLENYHIFMCLIAILKMSWKTFYDVWQAQKSNNISCLIQSMFIM